MVEMKPSPPNPARFFRGGSKACPARRTISKLTPSSSPGPTVAGWVRRSRGAWHAGARGIPSVGAPVDDAVPRHRDGVERRWWETAPGSSASGRRNTVALSLEHRRHARRSGRWPSCRPRRCTSDWRNARFLGPRRPALAETRETRIHGRDGTVRRQPLRRTPRPRTGTTPPERRVRRQLRMNEASCRHGPTITHSHQIRGVSGEDQQLAVCHLLAVLRLEQASPSSGNRGCSGGVRRSV